MLLSTVVLGLVLGGTYALAALGLTLQYGIARIMNLAYGEFVIAASFLAYVLFTGLQINPVIGLLLVVPGGFVVCFFLYEAMLKPLVRRAPGRGSLEIDSILATFGLLFVIQGIMLVLFGGNITGYSYLNTGVSVLGVTVAANKLMAFCLAVTLGAILYLLISRTRWGLTLMAVAHRPDLAPLAGIDMNRTARLAFAIGGALAAAGGVMMSMHQTFTATSGVNFTMKALMIIIMGGVGNIAGALSAGLLLGLVETFVAAYIDPGLTMASTYLIFLAMLLMRPQGLFGKSVSRS